MSSVPKEKKGTYKITIRTSPTQGKKTELCSQGKKRTYKLSIRTSLTQGKKTMSFAAKEKI